MHHARQHKAARKMLERFEARRGKEGGAGAEREETKGAPLLASSCRFLHSLHCIPGLKPPKPSAAPAQALNRRLLHSAKSGDLNEASMALEAHETGNQPNTGENLANPTGLEAGAFVDTLDADGASPLLHAASQRNLSMAGSLAFRTAGTVSAQLRCKLSRSAF